MPIRTLIAFLIGLTIAAPADAQDPFGEPREVKIGLLMTDLTEVNGAEQSFSADLFMLATWHDPGLGSGSLPGLRLAAHVHELGLTLVRRLLRDGGRVGRIRRSHTRGPE